MCKLPAWECCLKGGKIYAYQKRFPIWAQHADVHWLQQPFENSSKLTHTLHKGPWLAQTELCNTPLALLVWQILVLTAS